MSLITCCPACGTKFRVVADQLRISDGWVRCGRCQEVFDAQLALQTVTPAVTAGPAPQVAPHAQVPPAEPKPTASPAQAPAAAPESAPAPSPLSAPSAAGYELPVPPQPEDDAPWDEDLGSAGDWEVLPPTKSKAEIQQEVRDLRKAPAPGLPSVEVLSTSAPANASEPNTLATTRVATSQTPPSVAAPPPPAGISQQEPEWDASGLEFPDEAAASAPMHAEVEAMAQAFAQEMEAGGVFGHAMAPPPPVPAAAMPQPHPGRDTDLATALDTEPLGTPVQEALPQAPEAALAPQVVQQQPPPRAAPSAQEDTAATPAPALPTEQPSEALAQGGSAAAHAQEDAALAAGADSEGVPEFMKQAQRKAWWSQPAVRFAMGMLVMLLPLALALQVVVQERNALAAWKPQWRPALENLCVALQCTLQPRQDIAAVVVSDSHFAATNTPYQYQLELGLRNRSAAAVAMPAVEVTLTDSQEQVLVRKVLLPQDLGAPAELGAHAEWTAQMPVTTRGLQLPVSGYRLTVFYP